MYSGPDKNLPRQEPTAAVPSNYTEYLLVSNPDTGGTGGNGAPANIRVEFTKPSGNSYYDFQVPAGGRYTLNVGQFAYGEDVSLKVIADREVVAERAMYFDSGGRTDGHAAMGVTDLSREWYFAEGYTAEKFDEWIFMQNPHGTAVGATVTLMRDDGYTEDFPYKLAPYSRKTVHVDELPGFENANVSAKVTASKSIAAERAMYFDYKGFLGGHDEHGVVSAGREWYLAEGYTVNDAASQFDTYVLLQNPSDKAVTVNVTYCPDPSLGGPFTKPYTVGAHSRYTAKVDNEFTGSLGMKVSCDAPVMAERAMYFNYGTSPVGRAIVGGHCVCGSPAASKVWYFAEGYTGY